ncbi:MAG: SEC-C metal-binding domain-containing protein [Sphingomonas sp.]
MIYSTNLAFERTSKRRKGYPSETNVKRGVRFVNGDKELVEKLGRNDRCPCGSGSSFQAVLPQIGPLSMALSVTIIGATDTNKGAGSGQSPVAPITAIHRFVRYLLIADRNGMAYRGLMNKKDVRASEFAQRRECAERHSSETLRDMLAKGALHSRETTAAREVLRDRGADK